MKNLNDQTAEKAKPFDEGNALYQQRARAALPLLIRQAKAHTKIYYSDLAEEMGIPNPKNLNYVLGSVGQVLLRNNQDHGTDIPPVQCLVVNKATGLPGEGVGFFVSKSEFKRMTRLQKEAVVDAQLRKIFLYADWDTVLQKFSPQPVELDFSQLMRRAGVAGRNGGESEHHRLLKERIAANPQLIGLPAKLAPGEIEHLLPSADKIDVLFRSRHRWIAVEVKSHISDESDITRGLFQCVKYRALLKACLLCENKDAVAQTLLATASPLPFNLIPLKNVLGIECCEIKDPLLPIQTA